MVVDVEAGGGLGTNQTFVKDLFLPQGKVSLSSMSFTLLLYYTVILQRIRIIVGEAGLEPGPLPQKSGAQPMSHHIKEKLDKQLYSVPIPIVYFTYKINLFQ